MAWNFQIRALGAAMALFSIGAAEAALTEQQVNEALGSVPGVAWSVEGPDAEAWTVTGSGATRALKFSSAVATGTFALKATVTGPGVIELTTSTVGTPFDGDILLDGEYRLAIPIGWPKRVTVGPGVHTVTWRGIRINRPNASGTSATFKGAKWEPYAELPLSVGAKDESVTLSNGWVGQDRWHRGDGGAVYSAEEKEFVQRSLRGDFTGPGILTYWALVRNESASIWIDGQPRDTISSGDGVTWERRWHGIGAGNHFATWDGAHLMGLVLDEIQVVQEVDLATALDLPGRVWTSAYATGETRALGLPTDGAVGGSAVLLNRSSSFSTVFAGGGIFKIRQRGNVPVFTLGHGERLSYASTPDGDSGWVTRTMVIPATGTNLKIAADAKDAEFDAAEWLPGPVTFAQIFGLPEETTSTGGEGAWVPALTDGKIVAKTSLTEVTPTAWMEMNVTGPAKVTFGYDAKQKGKLEFLLDGEMLWNTTNSGTNRVTLAVPAGQHVVRLVARNVSGAVGYPYPFEPEVSEVTVVPDGLAADITEALGFPGRWVYGGEWEKVAAPSHDGNAALKPKVPAGATGTVSAWLGTTVTGPGYLTWWTGVLEGDAVVNHTMNGDLFYSYPPETRAVEDGWVERRKWIPQGTHKVQMMLSGSPLGLEGTVLDEMSLSPSAPAALEAVATGEPVVWENDPDEPWTAVVKEPGTPAVAVSPLRDRTLAPNEPWDSRLVAKVKGPGLLKFKWSGNNVYSMNVSVNGTAIPIESAGSFTLEIPAGESRVEWTGASYSSGWVELSEVEWQPWPESTLASALDTPEGVAWESGGDAVFTGRPDAGAKNGTAAHVRLEPGQSSWIEATMDGPGVFDFWLRQGATNGDYWQYNTRWVVTVDGTEVLHDSGIPSWDPIWVRGEGQHKVRVTFTNGMDRAVSGLMDEVTWIPRVQRTLDSTWTTNVAEETDGYTGADGEGFLLRTSYYTPAWIEKTVEGPCEVVWDSLAVGGPELIGGQPTVTVDGNGAVVMERGDGLYRNVVVIPAGTHVIRWSNVTGHDQTMGWIMPEEKQGSYWRISDPVVTPGVSPIAEALDAPDSCWLVQGVQGGVITGAGAQDGVDAYALGLDGRFHYFNLAGSVQRLRGGIRFEAEETWHEMRMVAEAGESILWGGPYGFAVPRAYDLDAFVAETLTETTPHEAVDVADEMPNDGWRGIVSASESADGVDAAWSLVDDPFDVRTMGMTVNGASRIRFRWKQAGHSLLMVRLNGGLLPVARSGAAWAEVSIEVGDGVNRIEWEHKGREGTALYHTGEAWLDAVVIEPLVTPWDLTAAASGDSGVTLTANVPADASLQWKPVRIQSPGGGTMTGARGATGASVMQASITGPTVVSFRSACFATKAVEGMSGTNARGGKSVEVSVGIGGGGSGSSGLVAGYELTVMMGSKMVANVPHRDGIEWDDVSFFVPAGTHVITWRVSTLRTGSIPGAYSREPAQWVDLQGWVSDLRLESRRERFDRWAESLPEGSRGPDDDADGDGVSNVLEYAFRSSPGDASSKPLQVTGKKGFTWPLPSSPYTGVVPRDGLYYVGVEINSFELMVPYLSQLADGTLEMSGDLETWDEYPVEWLEAKPLGTAPIDFFGHTDTHQAVRVPLSQEDTAKFFRVRVAVPE